MIGHTSKKISLFAAQEGARLYAGKGKIDIQAQGDGADLIAKQAIQIISTEDTVYITSPKEINLTAGGSQVKLNGSGIFPTTGGKFEAKAGQHKFIGGQKISYHLPNLRELKYKDYSIRFDLSEYFLNTTYSDTEYRVYNESGYYFSGKLDPRGRTERYFSNKEEEFTLYIDIDTEVEEEILEIKMDEEK